ncbi:MAG: DUF4292 domain-containing protein [Myxococcota bacterium]
MFRKKSSLLSSRQTARRLPWIVVTIGALLQAGCNAFPHRLPLTNPTAQQALQALHKQKQARKQLRAHLQVRATGIAAMMGTQNIDVLVQPPRLLLSWRSFFDQPALVASYNGQQVCLFEPSQNPPITCHDVTPHDTSWLQTLPLKMSPQQISAALLGVVPNVQNSKPIAFALDKNGRQHRTVLLHPNGNRSLLQAHVSTGVLTRYELHDAKGRMQYRVDYDMLQQHKQNMFPQRIRLHTLLGKRQIQLILHLKQAQWNAEPLPPNVFDLHQATPSCTP